MRLVTFEKPIPMKTMPKAARTSLNAMYVAYSRPGNSHCAGRVLMPGGHRRFRSSAGVLATRAVAQVLRLALWVAVTAIMSNVKQKRGGPNLLARN